MADREKINAARRLGRSIHTCHAEGCGVIVPPQLLMCLRHWHRVPKDLQAEVLHLYRRGQERDKRPTIEYLDAMQKAINYVARLEGRKERPLPSELIAKQDAPQ